MVTTDKVTVTEFTPHIGKTTTDYKENDMGVTYFKIIEAYFKSLPTDDFSKDMLKKVRETEKAYDELKAKEIDLVRCGECKHYDTESRTFPCCTDIFGAVRYMEADGFCSKGERRADEHTDKRD